MRKSATFRSALAAVGWAMSFSVYASANGPPQLDIPAGNLIPALEALEKQAAIELVFQPEQLKSFHTRGVKGTHEPEEAVRLLLKGTPLELRTDPSGAMVIVPPHAAVTRAQPQTQVNGGGGKADDSRSGLQLAQAGQGTSSGSTSVDGQVRNSPQESSKSETSGMLQEVIVTAQKRAESLLSVPVPVSALGGDTLVTQNQVRIQDYFSQVPNLSYVPDPNGGANLAIRGISTGPGSGNPVVGVTIDDVPFGSSSGYGGDGVAVPDLDPGELARVEVLRGPQGTLYGASSMGGLIKFVTLDPSTESVSGRLQAGLASIDNGNTLGYNVRGSVNLPVNDSLAVRASAFTREDPGYIENIQTGQKGVNEGQAYGGRIVALWRPQSDAVSVKLGFQFQHTNLDGSPYQNPALGSFAQSFLRGTGNYYVQDWLATGSLSARIGTMDFQAITGFGKRSLSSDGVATFAETQSEAQFGVQGASDPFNQTTSKFTEELRLSGPLWSGLDMLLGAFYTHESSLSVYNVWAIDPATGAPVGSWLSDIWPTTYGEVAGYIDLTYHFTSRLSIQVGGRESQNRQTYRETLVGPFGPVFAGLPSPIIQPELDTTGSSFTYLVTPTLQVSPDVMLYMRAASGYRPGGPNPTSTVYHLPSSFVADTTENYDLGIKGTALGKTLSFDASLYYIDWKKIQLAFVDYQVDQSFFANGSRAKSEGIELSLESRPLQGLTVSTWIVWDDAKLTEPLPAASPVYGATGAQLPFNSRFSGNLTVRQDFPIGAGLTGFIAGTVSYVGNHEGLFQSGASTPRWVYPGYAKTDLNAGLTRDLWTVNFFSNNITNKRAYILSGLDSAYGVATNNYYFLPPRTIGMNVIRFF